VGVRLVEGTGTGAGGSKDAGGGGVTCAFVNNMPDAAFDATERQFLELLDAGSGPVRVDVQRYTMTGVPRGERTAARIAEHYGPPSDIRQLHPDLLIVTGSNPVEPRIEDEPYWDEMATLLSWAGGEVPSLLLSCLSAHSALAVFDGIERGRLASKCTGVFPQETDAGHPLTEGMEAVVPLPHSRVSNVPKEALIAAGYRIAMQSAAVGWSVATRAIGGSQVVLVQGHPEYDPSSLLREYHRDARRYVHHERDELPVLPVDCVAPDDWAGLQQLHCAITGPQRLPSLIDSYPFDEVGARAGWPWRRAAARLYANWSTGATTGRV
jgi:homoserine O-succinyltransferase/O-acetyltransferase